MSSTKRSRWWLAVSMLYLEAMVATAAPAFDEHVFVLTASGAVGSCSAIAIDPPWGAQLDLEPTSFESVVRHFCDLHFVVARSPANLVQVIDPETFDTVRQFSVGSGANPQDILVAAPENAFVSCFDSPWLYRVNPATGATLDSLDLSVFADADGLPEASMLARDGDHLLVQIQRVDRIFTNQPVPPANLAVVSIDSFELVDVDPGTPGIQAIELAGLMPSFRMHVDAAARRLYVCDAGIQHLYTGGIEAIDLDALSSLGMVTQESQLWGFAGGFAVVSAEKGYVIVHTDIVPSTHIFPFSLIDGSVSGMVYEVLGREVHSLAFDAATSQLFIPDPAHATPGVQVLDTVTDQILREFPIDTGLPPYDLIVARRDQSSGVDGAGSATRSPVSGLLRLQQNLPNPFNLTTTIRYRLTERARVSLRVFDPAGRLVQVLKNRVEESAGTHESTWAGEDARGRKVAPGVYFYRLSAGAESETRRMVLARSYHVTSGGAGGY